MPVTKYIKEPITSHKRVSKYAGVKQVKGTFTWESYLFHNKVRYTCGMFDCDREAAKARDIKIVSMGLKKPLQVLKISPVSN